MKTHDEMLKRYKELYHDMVDSKDPKKMMVFGEAENYVFRVLTTAHPEMADNWLSHLEATQYDNYLSENETMNIGKRLVNQDGSKGFHWDMTTFKKVLEQFGVPMEDKPCYNCYALYVTTNMIYSDHARSIAEDMGFANQSEVTNEKMALSCYRKAIEMLKDPDGGFRIRKYFKDKMYNDSPMQ